ncbi:MAG: DUF5060 domain-containing protein [Kiritimatiellae bacterium]|nr:DUF5060 domain-containing protein [Kiritimatiellia bacterium]
MKTMRRWTVGEIKLTARHTYENPYTDVNVTAVFRGPRGTRKTVRAFWDGGKTFIVRFTPTRPGSWRYTITNDRRDPGLKASGAVQVRPAPAGAHGFVRVDPAHPYHFVYDDGTRYFMLGTTYYCIVQNALAGDRWKKSIDQIEKYGISKARILLYPWGATNYPDSEPFEGDHDHLNLKHWRALDRVIGYMAERGIVADLMWFANVARHHAKITQDHRYVRYGLARFAAYPNVIWCLTNEWNYAVQRAGKKREDFIRIGKIVRKEDPWLEEGAYRRPLSTHQQTRVDFQFHHCDWHTHVIVQNGRRNWERFAEGDRWGNLSIVYNWGYNMPVVNDEYGYIGETDKQNFGDGTPRAKVTRAVHRNAMWSIYAAAGYGSTADHRKRNGAHGWQSADWHEHPGFYGDIKRLVDFFTRRGIAYWKMWPANAIVSAGDRVYACGHYASEYVVYAAAGGEFDLKLPDDHAYCAVRYDPRTGKTKRLPDFLPRAFRVHHVALPKGKDWALHIKRKGGE